MVMSRREKQAGPLALGVMMLLMGGGWAMACRTLPPQPQPSPTPSPNPTPTPEPTPAPCVPPMTEGWDVQPGADTLRANLNVAMASVTGCEINSDCPLDVDVDTFFARVTQKLREDGLCAGVARPGEDQIIVGLTRCGWYEAYHVYNFGGRKVVWAAGAYRDDWRPQSCSE